MNNEEAIQAYHLYSRIPGWLNLVATLGASEKTLVALENYDDSFIQFNEGFDKNGDLRDFVEINKVHCPEARNVFLKGQLFFIDERITKIEQSYNESRENDEPFINRALLSSILDDLRKQKRRFEIEFIKPTNGRFQDFQLKLERAKLRKIEEFIEVKNGKALCPFHDDHDPSFSIWKGKGHCFGCGWSGDVLDFIQKKRGISFKEAIEILE